MTAYVRPTVTPHNTTKMETHKKRTTTHAGRGCVVYIRNREVPGRFIGGPREIQYPGINFVGSSLTECMLVGAFSCILFFVKSYSYIR